MGLFLRFADAHLTDNRRRKKQAAGDGREKRCRTDKVRKAICGITENSEN